MQHSNERKRQKNNGFVGKPKIKYIIVGSGWL